MTPAAIGSRPTSSEVKRMRTRLLAGDKNPTVSAHEAESAKVSTRMRTVEAADAPKVRLRAEIVPK